MRHVITVLLTAACLALAGCSDSKPSTTDAKPSPSVDKKATYLGAAREITFNGEPTDEELLLYPPEWCAGLDAGHSVEWLFSMDTGLYPIGEQWGTKKPDANELLVAGVKAYCPENSAAVLDELRASGEY